MSGIIFLVLLGVDEVVVFFYVSLVIGFICCIFEVVVFDFGIDIFFYI